MLFDDARLIEWHAKPWLEVARQFDVRNFDRQLHLGRQRALTGFLHELCERGEQAVGIVFPFGASYVGKFLRFDEGDRNARNMFRGYKWRGATRYEQGGDDQHSMR